MLRFYGGYRGRSVGRIYSLIEVYCGLRYAEEASVDGNKVTYCGKVIAEYQWIGDTDNATFKFADANHQKNYQMYRYFIEDPTAMYNVSYVVQETRRYLQNNLGGEVTIKKMLKEWWYPLCDDKINEYYPKLMEVVSNVG